MNQVINKSSSPTDFRANHYFEGEEAKFVELMMMYECAIKEITTKLEILSKEFTVKRNRCPIEFISSRVKSPDSIVGKLERKNLNISVKNVSKYLDDIAGVRVICSFIDDIFDIADMLTKQDDIVLLECKNYIKNPKPNGYRSLHLIVEVPVFLSDRKQPVRVEIQIRTIAMDFWASLEHQLKYKKDIENANDIVKELKECADIIAQTDDRMLKIKNQIYHTQRTAYQSVYQNCFLQDVRFTL